MMNNGVTVSLRTCSKLYYCITPKHLLDNSKYVDTIATLFTMGSVDPQPPLTFKKLH